MPEVACRCMASDQLKLAAEATHSSSSQKQSPWHLGGGSSAATTGWIAPKLTLRQGLTEHPKRVALLKTRDLSAGVRLSPRGLQDASSRRLSIAPLLISSNPDCSGQNPLPLWDSYRPHFLCSRSHAAPLGGLSARCHRGPL